MTAQPPKEEVAFVERRHAPRMRFRSGIEIEWGSTVLNGIVRDIGPGGLFVELLPPLWIGAAFRARLTLSPVVELDCTVVRVEPGTGVAVTFQPLEDSGQAQMQKLLTSLLAT